MTFDILDPAVRRDPYPHYARLREQGSAVQIEPGGLWAISHHADIVSLLKQPQACSSAGLRPMNRPPWLSHNPMADAPIVLDPPEHTRFRKLVNCAFGPRVVPRIEGLLRQVCGDFVDEAAEVGEVDVCQTISADLPARVICELLGFDPMNADKLRGWSEGLVSVNPQTPEALRPGIVRAVADFEAYIREVLASRRAAPRDDLVSDLIAARVDGRPLSTPELVSFCFLLLVAGLETTSHLTTNALRILATHPELVGRLRAQPNDIPRFIDEVLRFDPPVHATVRVAMQPLDVSGHRLEPGSLILLLLGSAGRDPAVYAAPDVFDIDRAQQPSLAFGHGVHYCLGAALAKAEARIAIETITRRFERLAVVEPPTWNCALTTRGPLSCRMAFVPRVGRIAVPDVAPTDLASGLMP